MIVYYRNNQYCSFEDYMNLYSKCKNTKHFCNILRMNSELNIQFTYEKYRRYGDVSTAEAIYRHFNQEIKNECLSCLGVTRYDYTTKSFKRFCSTKCASRYNGIPPALVKFNKERKYTDGYDEYILRLKKASKAFYDSPAGTELKIKSSNIMKEKIARGEWTPMVTNSWTRWTARVDGMKFRSSFESIFYLFFKYVEHKTIEYEKLRIPYYDSSSNKIKIYIIDFIDYNEKTVYEIKPYSLLNMQRNIDKHNELSKWASINSYEYKIITEHDIKQYFISLNENEIFTEYLSKINEAYKWII